MKTWLLVDIEGDGETHAAPRNGNFTYCDRRFNFPMGGTDRPTCPECKTNIDALDPVVPPQRP
jgi:hypothetical protein